MKHFDRLADGETSGALVCFTDIARFIDIHDEANPDTTFMILKEMAQSAAESLEPTSGQIIKHIGDAMLIVFPAEATDEGVNVLLDLQARLHGILEEHGLSNRVTFGLHVGDVIVGRMPPFDAPDVFGSVVNTAATVDRRRHRGEFVITPQVFRRLEAATRKRFRKFTPPVVYLRRPA
jgi:class 3 adenylate cyclase